MLLPSRDGHPKLKDFPAAVRGSGELIAEQFGHAQPLGCAFGGHSACLGSQDEAAIDGAMRLEADSLARKRRCYIVKTAAKRSFCESQIDDVSLRMTTTESIGNDASTE